jgi:cytochrome c-type biogenesis protein CcmH
MGSSSSVGESSSEPIEVSGISTSGVLQSVKPKEVIDLEAREIFTTTMSPYCPGLLISDCPSGKASDLKVKIREQLAEGATVEQIRTELEVDYKAALDARPPVEGFGVLMWVVPAVLLLVGGIVAVRWIRGQVSGK